MQKTLAGLFSLLCAFFAFSGQNAAAGSRLINGTPVPAGTWKEVVRIRSDGAGCTATVVGPRAIITAAHCAKTGGTATFTIDGVNYSAVMTRSPVYPGQDHDVSLGIVTPEIKGITPASIGGAATTGTGITLLGYGCINAGGGGGNDGILRMGDSAIVEFAGFDMVSRKAGGAALCFGDSGGPAFVTVGGKKLLLGINSKGNIQDTNYNARLDHDESKKFLQNYTTQNNLQICGVNLNCGGIDPVDPAPTCTLSASPSTIKVGESTTIGIVVSGKATSAKINNKTVTFPTGSTTEVGTSVGTFSVQGEVTGPGGTTTCSASYNVQNGPGPTAPSCTLTATPSTIKKGESVTLEINVVGSATSAMIEGSSVSIPKGQKIVQGTSAGVFTASANATGAGGTGSCTATYEVTDGEDPVDPSAPNFSIVPSYCGQNTLTVTKVTKVCLAVVKKDASVGAVRVAQALLVSYYNDQNQEVKEVLPIIAVAQRPKNPGETSTKEDLTVYTNTLIPASNYLVMDTRKAVLTKYNGTTPVAVEGRTSTGKYFIVEQLTLPGVVHTPTVTAGYYNY